MLGSPEVVAKSRAWVVTVMEMERFVREGTRDSEAWQALLDQQRAGRTAYYAAVREEIGIPPGHSARRPARSGEPVSPQR